MKIKLSLEPEKIAVYLFLALLLLYIVAIGVLNMATFSQEAEFYGLNPIEAFSEDFIGVTFSFYVLALGGILYVLLFGGKGLDIFSKKKDKGGYSRWAKEDEVKKVLKKIRPLDPTFEHAGIPLITKPNEVWVDDGESHSLIIGSTGSGKTTMVVKPLIKILAKKGESMILTDPKGELYEESANMLIERGYNIIVLNLRNPSKGNAWNPLMLPYRLYKEGSDKANELLNDLALNLFHDEKGDDDPFWENTAADYFTGCALGLFEDAKVEEINLNSISYMTSVGEERYGSSSYIKQYFMEKDPSKPVYVNVASTINAPDTTRDSILSVFRQKIKIFALTEHLSEMLSYSDFDMKEIGLQKTAVFIIIQDEKKTYHALATVFVKQCYETLIDVAHENGGKLPIRTNFILDEFANMPPLKDVTTMITAARSRQIRFNLIIQNYAQLNQVYGKENAETIKGNCSNVVYLITKELSVLEELSKLCGEKKEKKKDGKETTKPLITISDLQRLKFKDTIILKDRVYPFKTKLLPMFEYSYGDKEGTKPAYPERITKPISLFDVRKQVKERKRENVFNAPFESGMLPSGLNEDLEGANESFNVDDLIKKIDAKIAQLEAEEIEKEEEQQLSSNQDGIKKEVVPKQEVVVDVKQDIEKILNDQKQEEITDDAFFDDFFSDDD
ncbi:MAG: VirD4-like conjugal transfer protein, CD1115 family [Bacilli bacterium]|jgi:type IV secretory pathway TraG/TraD family ATPase VirD4